MKNDCDRPCLYDNCLYKEYLGFLDGKMAKKFVFRGVLPKEPVLGRIGSICEILYELDEYNLKTTLCLSCYEPLIFFVSAYRFDILSCM
jgi:hypothetical protein